jgi:hypothetical protein
MRILVLGQGRNFPVDHAGGHDGFVRLLQEGRIAAYDHLSALDLAQRFGWQGMWSEVKRKVEEMNANVLFLRLFHHPQATDPTAGLLAIKQLPQKPMIITSLGDPFGRWFNTMPAAYRAATKCADLNLLSGMGFLARQLVQQGTKNIVLMPLAVCQKRFNNEFVPVANPEFDVLFIGSKVQARNPFGHYFWCARNRAKMVELLTRRYGKKFAIFGKGWDGNPSWQGPCNYQEQQKICQRARVVVGGMPNGYHDYYLSDRPFIALGSGVPFVDYHVPGIEAIFHDQIDWWLVEHIQDYARKVEALFTMSADARREYGENITTKIKQQHTSYHRTLNTINITQGLLTARADGTKSALPALEYLPNPKVYDTVKFPMLANWQG